MPLRTIRPSALVFPASTKAAQSQSAGVGPAHGNQERPWLVLVIWPNLWTTGRLAKHLHSPNTGCCSRFCATAGVLSGLGYRLGWWPLRVGFGIARWSAYFAIAAAVISLAGAV